MKKPIIIKILIGFVCTLLIMATVVWSLVYQQHKKEQGNVSQTTEMSTAMPTSEEPEEEMASEELTKVMGASAMPTEVVAPTAIPESFDVSRLANPMKEFMVSTDLAKSLGITKENYPRIDGSTSTFDLVQSIYWGMFEMDESLGDYQEDMGQPQAPAKTIPSYKNLIAGDVDLIIVPDPSQAVKDLERETGIELEYIPIGVEGLVFITQEANQVSNITLEQANEIYVERTTTNWSQLGGADGEILALCRNDDSGSQAQFDNLVLEEGKGINQEIKEKYVIDDMQSMVGAVSGEDPLYEAGEPLEYGNNFPLGYTIYYYLEGYEGLGAATGIKLLSVNNVKPTAATIATKEYPLTVGYFAVIRKETAQDAPARIIANWLTTDEGQQTVKWSGLGVLDK